MSKLRMNPTRDERRARPRKVRKQTIELKRMTADKRAFWRMLTPDDGKRRLPLTRGGCIDGPRPCPLVSCRHNLFLDVHPTSGNVILNFPDVAPEDMTFSCALDLADEGGLTLDDVGVALNLTRERVRQLEAKSLQKLRASLATLGLRRSDLVSDVDDPEPESEPPPKPPLEPEGSDDWYSLDERFL